MKKLSIFLLLFSLLTFGVNSAIFEDFEDDAMEFKNATYSGSTSGLLNDLAEITEDESNDRLNPSDGSAGIKSGKWTWDWDTANVDVSPADGFIDITSVGAAWLAPFVRITTYPTRYLIPNTAPAVANGGVGFYFLLKNGGPLEMSVGTEEVPTNTGDNENYEATEWRQVENSDYWQYLFFDFSTDILNDAVNSFGQSIGLGDGVNDCNTEPADESKIEGVYIRALGGVTPIGSIELFMDDFHDGTEHTPLGTPTPTPTPLAANSSVWGLYE